MIPLHAHTEKGSRGDSILKIDDYIKKAKEMGLKSIAITEHGDMSSIYNFYFNCVKNDIKPIIGCEVYEVNDINERASIKKSENNDNMYYHLVLLSKSDLGFKNLLNITSLSNLEGFYYKPRVDKSILEGRCDGIVALSGCVGGRIPQIILKSIEDKTIYKECLKEAVEAIKAYKELFKDDFYLEIQPGNFKEQIFVNLALVQLSKITKTKLVVTNDIHYLNKEDYSIHDISVKLNRQLDIEKFPECIYPDSCYYLMDDDDLKSRLNYIDKVSLEDAILNTHIIANECNLKIEDKPIFPRLTEINDSKSYFIEKLYESFNNKKDEFKDPCVYMDRLEYEIYTIDQLGFIDYFLIIDDILKFCSKSNIPYGPGRGSCAGSLVAYLLDITKVDPIKYDLMFERFLHVSRKAIPDIDLDISSEKRQMVFDYVINKYGNECCALVSTFGIRKARTAIRDSARVLGVDLDTADKIAKLIPTVFYGDEGEKETDLSIKDSIEIVDELKNYYKEYPELFDCAMKLEDLTKSTSIHAAGTLISPIPLINTIPLRKPDNSSLNATSLELSDAEKFFIKMDFLALKYLDIIDRTSKETNFSFDFKDYDDENVWSLIGSSKTTGLFQIASNTYKSRMGRIKPKNISELAACLALLRGPCISQKLDQKYINIINGTEEIELIHPLYDSATKETNGILLYQEQLLKLLMNFDFDITVAYDCMKKLAKKDRKKVLEYKDLFFEKSNIKNIDYDTAYKIWHTIEKLAEYSFNKSHAVAYAILCYQTAYMKVKKPIEYMKNAISCFALSKNSKQEDITALVNESIRMGINFLPQDINKSLYECSIENGKIRIGFCLIKSFGINAVNEILEKRPFTSIEDITSRCIPSKYTKRDMLSSIFSGALNSIGDPIDNYKILCESRKEKPEEDIVKISRDEIKLKDGISSWEQVLLGCQIISNEINDFEKIDYESIRNNNTFKIMGKINNIKKIKDKNNNEMCFVELNTANGSLDMTVFSKSYSKYKKAIKKNNIINIKGKKTNNESFILLEVI